MSRCGSTLVSRALARSARHVVRSQPGVLRDGIWSILTGRWTTMPSHRATELNRFRNLVRWLLRPGSGPAEAGFIKFYSENVRFLDFIRAAFPSVPCLFLFRDPVEVVASVAVNGTGMLADQETGRASLISGLDPAQIAAVSNLDFLIACYRRYFETVLGSPEAGLTLLDYQDLQADTFPQLVERALGHRIHIDDLDAVQQQFDWHSKSEPGAPKTYANDSARKRASVEPSDRQLIEQELGPWLDRLRRRAWSPSPAAGSPGDSRP
jgi:hypothetical protein